MHQAYIIEHRQWSETLLQPLVKQRYAFKQEVLQSMAVNNKRGDKAVEAMALSDRIERAVEDAIILIAPTSQVNRKMTSLDSLKLYRDAAGSGSGRVLAR